MSASAAICLLSWWGGGGGAAPGSGCYATRLFTRLFPINRLSLLLLRLMPCAHMDLLSRRHLCLLQRCLVCVCSTRELLSSKYRRSQPHWVTGTAAGREERGVYQPGWEWCHSRLHVRITQWTQVHVMIGTSTTKHWGTKPPRLQSFICYYASFFWIFKEYHHSLLFKISNIIKQCFSYSQLKWLCVFS